jgi:hypothetical protein
MLRPQWFENFKVNFFKRYGTQPGKMLIHTGIIGWVMSSLAQISAIIINDKIPKEQKMFMIPQEFADALINIASFYAVTRSMTGVANKAVKCGKLLPKSIKDYIIKSNLGKNLGKYNLDIGKHLRLPRNIKYEYLEFKNGIDVTATLIGSIVSCNIITPILRNIYASHRQKHNIAKMNTPKDPARPQSKYSKYSPLGGKSIYSFTNRGDLRV